MPKKPQTPDKPMQEVIAIRAWPEFKEQTINCAAKAGQTFSDYVRDAISHKNERTKDNVP